MVLKMFTYFEHPSVGLLYLLRSHFDEVWISKPSCSRASNAETYLVAKGVSLECNFLWTTNLYSRF